MKKFALIVLAGCLAVTFTALNGCAAPESPKWKILENDLALHIQRRSAVRTQLTSNPTSPDAAVLSVEIATLNRLVTSTERALSYSLTEPVSTEPVIVAYTGPLPLGKRIPIKVTESVWNALTADEQTRIGEKWNVKVLGSSSYGFVIDSQTANESTAGTQNGSNLGGALGETLYIDRAFKSGNTYSATQQLAAGVAGAIVGSLLNTAPTTWYRTRYSVRVADGSIQMADQVRSDPFRLPASMCVELPSLDNSDQMLCTQTTDSIREKYVSQTSARAQ